jgi:ribosomal protein S18 acetylase RimI-like enzyme
VSLEIRRYGEEDRSWLLAGMDERWGGPFQVEDGAVLFPADQEGFVAVDGDERLGVVTFSVEHELCRIGLLESLREHAGIGRALVEAVVGEARARRCASVRVTTTNDNVRARRLYERSGFAVAEVRPGAVTEARNTLKPTIPVLGEDGTEIADEIGFELPLR